MNTSSEYRTELDIQQALEAARLIWPKLLSRDDCILMADNFTEESYRDWRSSLPDHPGSIENVINHVHLRDVFFNSETTEPELVEFAGFMVAGWRAAAFNQFPENEFEILLLNDELDGPTV